MTPRQGEPTTRAGASSSSPPEDAERLGGSVPEHAQASADAAGTTNAAIPVEGDSGPPAQAGPRRGPEHGSPAVAFLLAAAAIAAAIVGFRVAGLAGEASGHWQSAVRLEVKRSTGAQETVRYLYDTEIPLAITILRARLVLDELEATPASQGGSDPAVIIAESVETEVLKALEPSSDLTKVAYALAGGGVDLGKRLADLRAQTPATVTVDPESEQSPGDASATRADRMAVALIPFGITGFFGVAAHAFDRRRRPLLTLGGAALVAGIVLALIVEVLL
jgi:hypothetical protein